MRTRSLFLILFFTLLILEIFAGYFSFLIKQRQSSIAFLFQLIKNKLETVSQNDTNPFLVKRFNLNGFGYKLHPFLDYTGVHTRFYPQPKLDYFGFRNSENHYFIRPKGLFIVITGGSEAAGFNHTYSIAQYLEPLLSEKLKTKVHVLNLAMNSYCLANEINSYVQLADSLHPDAVISHSGWNDAFYGLMVPSPFKKLGFAYLKHFEIWWLPRLYELNENEGTDPWSFNNHGATSLSYAFAKNLNKYKRIVQSNQSSFISIIQKTNPNYTDLKHPEFYVQVQNTFDQIKTAAVLNGSISLDTLPMNFIDSIHTDENGARETSKKMAEVLLPILNTKLLKR